MSELSIARQYSHTPQVEHRAGLPRDFRVMHRDFGVDPSSSFVSVAVTTALEPCADQLALARASLTQHSKQLGRKIVTEISPLEVFWVSVLAVLADPSDAHAVGMRCRVGCHVRHHRTGSLNQP